jgi:hypothetical protein
MHFFNAQSCTVYIEKPLIAQWAAVFVNKDKHYTLPVQRRILYSKDIHSR